MEYRWLAEAAARKLNEQTDAHRRCFYASYFGFDWACPLGYHASVNTGRPGAVAVALVDFLAVRSWARA
jgi:hypothetical protein